MPTTTIKWNVISSIEEYEEDNERNVRSQFHIKVKDMQFPTYC